MANSRVETLLEVQKLRTEILGGEKKIFKKYPFSLIIWRHWEKKQIALYVLQ